MVAANPHFAYNEHVEKIEGHKKTVFFGSLRRRIITLRIRKISNNVEVLPFRVKDSNSAHVWNNSRKTEIRLVCVTELSASQGKRYVELTGHFE